MSPTPRSFAALVAVACLLCGLLPGAAAQACQAGCKCGSGKIVCHEDFVINPPKSAILVRGLKPFCNAVELELMQLGSGRCATPLGRLMDCVRQVVDPLTPTKLCDFHPSLEQTKCTCPAASTMCKQLAQFRTRAHGSYVPTELYRSLGCTPPASSLRSKVTTMLRSDVCQGFATQVTTYGKIALKKFWPKVQEVLPDPLRIDSARPSFPRTDIGIFYVDGWAGLNSVNGIKTLSLPDFKVDSVTTCTNLSSLQSKVSLSTSIKSLSAKGGAGITLDNWMMTVPLELSLTLSVTNTKVGIKGSTSVGIFPTAESAGVSAAVTSIDSVDLKLGDVDIDLQFLVWTPWTWVLGKVLSLFTSIVRGIFPSLEQSLNDVLKNVLNDNLKFMAANVDI